MADFNQAPDAPSVAGADGPNPAAFGWHQEENQAPMRELLPPIATRYMWQDDFGEVGPEVPELEKALFADAGSRPPGDDLDVLTSVPVTLEGPGTFRPFVQVHSFSPFLSYSSFVYKRDSMLIPASAVG